MIIGITGKSGDGKTTIAHILRNNIEKSEVISIDLIQVALLMKSKELIDLYGPNIIKNNKICFNILLKDSVRFKKIHDITKKKLTLIVLNIIKKHLNQNKNIIIEWVRLPELEEVWNLCDFHILVKSTNPEERYNHIKSRVRDIDNINKSMTEELDLRDKCSLNYDNYSYDFVLINRYDDTLEKQTKLILSKKTNDISNTM